MDSQDIWMALDPAPPTSGAASVAPDPDPASTGAGPGPDIDIDMGFDPGMPMLDLGYVVPEIVLDGQRMPPPPLPPRPARPLLNIEQFPERPFFERANKHVRVLLNGMEIAETNEAYWVHQLCKPPEYYLPRSCVKVPLKPTGYRLPCEHKGPLTHYSITGRDGVVIANRMWSLEDVKPPYEVLKGHVSFYARPWQCFVDGERVVPHRADIRGGWVTPEVIGLTGPRRAF